MSQDIKQLARRFLTAFASADVPALETIVAEDVADSCAPPGARPGRHGLLDAAAMFHEAFPDLEISIEREVAENDTVAVFGLIRGTHQGPLMGAPPTGRKVVVPYMDMYRIAGDRIVETWHVEDMAGMLTQLGIGRA